MIEPTYQPKTLGRDGKRGMKCRNVSGEDMPAYSACVVTAENGDTYDVSKPIEDSAKEVLFSPPHVVPLNGIFFAVSPYDELVTYNGSVSPGDEVGTVSGQWYVESGQTGFAVLSGSGGVARCRPFSTNAKFAEIAVDGYENSTTDLGLFSYLYSDFVDLSSLSLSLFSGSRNLITILTDQVIDDKLIRANADLASGKNFGLSLGAEIQDTSGNSIRSFGVNCTATFPNTVTDYEINSDTFVASGPFTIDRIRFFALNYDSGSLDSVTIRGFGGIGNTRTMSISIHDISS